MSLVSRVRKAWAIRSVEGLAGVGRRLRHYGRPRLYSVYWRDVRDLEVNARTAGDIRVGSLTDLREWRRRHGSMAAPFYADERNGWSEFCWAWSTDQPMGVVWTTTKSPLLATRRREAVIVDLYTVPGFRGHGVGTQLIMAACAELRRREFQSVYATVETDNVASRRAFERSGFSAVGELMQRGWCRFRFRTARWTRPT